MHAATRRPLTLLQQSLARADRDRHKRPRATLTSGEAGGLGYARRREAFQSLSALSFDTCSRASAKSQSSSAKRPSSRHRLAEHDVIEPVTRAVLYRNQSQNAARDDFSADAIEIAARVTAVGYLRASQPELEIAIASLAKQGGPDVFDVHTVGDGRCRESRAQKDSFAER